jgi:hypothetical protein
VSALEQPLDRVNYFNGQRLEAADFRADQEYQMRVRRKLYSTLYSTGIVQGLEVRKHATDLHKVVVAPGVALDFLGREIILLRASEVQVAGTPNTTPGVIFGNFLVISYTEQRVHPVSDGCSVNAPAKGCTGNLAWGAPTRIRAEPKLEMVETWPADQSGKIVLAQIGLQAGCQVSDIQSGARRYAVQAKPTTTRAISLEGEKDIDPQNSKVVFFHIDGNVPNAVTLYLRASKFSTLFYTELGSHQHTASITMQQLAAVPAHRHPLNALQTDKQLGGGAVHAFAHTVPELTQPGARDCIVLGYPLEGFALHDLTTEGPQFTLQGIEHSHGFPGGQTEPAGAIAPVRPMGSVKIDATGLKPPPAARTDPDEALQYVDTLLVKFDNHDITAQILAQLEGNDPTNWPKNSRLGNGTGNHPLVFKGTGPIILTQLGLDFTPGEHSLEFMVNGGGGQIRYNLYVE